MKHANVLGEAQRDSRSLSRTLQLQALAQLRLDGDQQQKDGQAI